MRARTSRARAKSRRNRIQGAETREVCLFNYLQLTHKWRDWAYRTVSQNKATELVREGKAEPITRMKDGRVQVVGFKLTKPERTSRPTACTLTRGTMEQVAEAVRSEDHAERRAGVVKFHVWAHIPETFRDAEGRFVPGGVYRSPTIRPRMSAAEAKQAQALLRISIEVSAPAPVIAWPVPIATEQPEAKPLAQRTASDALAAVAPRLGLKVQTAARAAQLA